MRVTWWKAVGLASVVGVAATGVVIARGQRRRLNYSPDEVRARLHARVAEIDHPAEPDSTASTTTRGTSPDALLPQGRWFRRPVNVARRWITRVRRR